MLFDRFYYEVKLLGKKLFLTPLLLVAVPTALAVWMKFGGHIDPARLLLAVAEMLFPLATGVIVGTIVAVDPAVELQLTLPQKYDRTGILRISLVLALMLCCLFLFTNALDFLKLLYMPTFMNSWSPFIRFLAVQLIWLVPLLWCTVIGFCIALLLQSRIAASALFGCIWVGEIIFKDSIAITPWLRPVLLFPSTLVGFPATYIHYSEYVTYFLTTRLDLFITAVALFPLGWLLLRNTDRMLRGAVAE